MEACLVLQVKRITDSGPRVNGEIGVLIVFPHIWRM